MCKLLPDFGGLYDKTGELFAFCLRFVRAFQYCLIFVCALFAGIDYVKISFAFLCLVFADSREHSERSI